MHRNSQNCQNGSLENADNFPSNRLHPASSQYIVIHGIFLFLTQTGFYHIKKYTPVNRDKSDFLTKQRKIKLYCVKKYPLSVK